MPVAFNSPAGCFYTQADRGQNLDQIYELFRGYAKIFRPPTRPGMVNGATPALCLPLSIHIFQTEVTIDEYTLHYLFVVRIRSHIAVLRLFSVPTVCRPGHRDQWRILINVLDIPQVSYAIIMPTTAIVALHFIYR